MLEQANLYKESVFFLSMLLHENGKFFHCFAGNIMLYEACILLSYRWVDAEHLAKEGCESLVPEIHLRCLDLDRKSVV